MGRYEKFQTNDADELGHEITKRFGNYGVHIKMKEPRLINQRIIFEVILKGGTTEAQLFARVSDVQLRMKLPLFQVLKKRLMIFIVASEVKIEYPPLLKVLKDPTKYINCKRNIKIELPYMVGFDALGFSMILDLARENHLLMGGSSGSGKSVALQCMILSLLLDRSVEKLNLLIFDTGANDLTLFDGIPHLSCPVIKTPEAALEALRLLKIEMERRITLELTNYNEFRMLPRIVCIIDEFPALISGITDKQNLKLLIETISNLLRRGRHAKIHLVLAAQNPTALNMKIDLGPVTTRMAFKCAKRNFSETILGERGAEDLEGKGEMYIKSPNLDGIQRIQGVFISPLELKKTLLRLKINLSPSPNSGHKFLISETDLHPTKTKINDTLANTPNSKNEIDEELFSEIVIWALGRDLISCNAICDTFHIGWKRAKYFLELLRKFEIVGDLYEKLPRAILPMSLEDLSTETVKFLSKNGISVNDLADAIRKRKFN